MARSPESLRQMGIMDPSLERALKVRPFPEKPGDYFQRREARAAHLRTLRHLMPVPGPIPESVTEKEILVPVRDGHKIRVIHYAPTIRPATAPALVLLYHEGGWGMGDLSDEEFNARMLTRDLGVVCINVEYRLGPENPFPAFINDAWDVLHWAVDHASTLYADPARGLIVGGSSAGGHISAILAHLSRKQTGLLRYPVTGQWLSAAFLMSESMVPEKYKAEYLSMPENTTDPVMFGGVSNEKVVNLLALHKIDITSPLYSVVAPDYYPPTDEDQKSKSPLAKAFIQVGGLDPLRDHSLIYDRMLRLEYGTDTRVEVYPGFGHMFWANWPELDTSRKFSADMVEGFRWLLSGH